MALQDLRFIVVDTETSGATPGTHSPCEVGWVLTSLTGVIVSGATLVNPGHPITNEAKAVHHILDEDVADAPNLMTALKTQMVPQLADQIIDGYAAHNAKFDSAMLPMLNKKPWLCTYLLAKKLYPNLTHLTNQFLRYELNLEVPEVKGLPAHRALADAFVTAALLRHLLQKIQTERPELTTLEDILALTREPSLVQMCPFNKHRGKTWEEVVREDADYCQWVLSPSFQDLDADTRFTLEHWQKVLWPKGWPPRKARR